MKTGNVIFIHNPFQWRFPFQSIFWWLIRVCSNSHYNHCALYWEADGQGFIVEADGRGVCATYYDIWKNRAKREILIFPVECDSSEFLVHLGKKYDYLSLFLYCLWKLIRKVWIGPSYTKGTKKLYCFELVAYAHNVPEANQILPNELLKYFNTHL